MGAFIHAVIPEWSERNWTSEPDIPSPRLNSITCLDMPFNIPKLPLPCLWRGETAKIHGVVKRNKWGLAKGCLSKQIGHLFQQTSHLLDLELSHMSDIVKTSKMQSQKSPFCLQGAHGVKEKTHKKMAGFTETSAKTGKDWKPRVF